MPTHAAKSIYKERILAKMREINDKIYILNKQKEVLSEILKEEKHE